MLSLFPEILFLAPMGVALLRITAGLTFLSLGYWRTRKLHELSHVRFPFVGSGTWLVVVLICIEGATGAALLVGHFAQLAAIFGALLALKYLVWCKRFPQFFPLERSTHALLFIICLSLIVSGAGAFAFDLPL